MGNIRRPLGVDLEEKRELSGTLGQGRLSMSCPSAILMTAHFLHGGGAGGGRLEENYTLGCLWKVELNNFLYSFQLSCIFHIFCNEYKLWGERKN